MTELPLSPEKMPTSRIVTVDPSTVRPSLLNPRAKFQITEASVAGLATEIAAVGQINDAHGEFAADGTLEIFNGLRRAAGASCAGGAAQAVHAGEVKVKGQLRVGDDKRAAVRGLQNRLRWLRAETAE